MSKNYQMLRQLSSKQELFITLMLAIYCTYDLIVSLAIAYGFTTDDTYISWIYARQLAHGNFLLWHISSPPVEGYSNFLWIIIASTVIKLKLPLLTTMKFISCFSLAAGLIFLYRLSRLFFSPLLAVLPVFLFSHYLGVVWWTISGLESIFYCTLSLLLIWQIAIALGYRTIKEKQQSASVIISIDESKQQPLTLASGFPLHNGHGSDSSIETMTEAQKSLSHSSTKAWLIANFTLLLLCLTRFEGPIWIIPITLFIWCHYSRYGVKKLFINSKMPYIWGSVTLFCFILPYAVYFIWRLIYFGHLIPNSYSCKWLRPEQIFVVDFDYLQVLFPLIVASLPCFLSIKDCRHILLWLPSVLYGLMLWKASPVIAYYSRLFLSSFAAFSLLPVLGVFQFMRNYNWQKLDPKISTTIAIILLTILFVPNHNSQLLQTLVTNYQERTKIRLTIAKILNTKAEKGATVLLNDCGLIPFKARRDIHFIDGLCLNNYELTKTPYNHNLNLYVDHLYNDIKPNWVITTYYPIDPNSNDLMKLMQIMQKKKFFSNYKLIATLKSGFFLKSPPGYSKKTIDYIYQVYKRNT